jgi:LysM repeat protein
MITTRQIFHTTLTIAFGVVCFSASAQKYRLPAAHQAEHSDLIAAQHNVGEQIKVQDTEQFIDNLFTEEEEPELDIYNDGWTSQSVNCYRNAVVPQTKRIDVSNFAMPCPGYVTSPYGYRRRFRRMHKGIDLKVQIGDTIRAAFDGKVRLTKFERKGYGYYVVIRHTNELETVYGHLSKFLVAPDQYVKAGDPIALGGNTGHSTGSHLHFETRFMGYAINPAAIFDFANQTTHTDIYTFDKNTYENARDYSPRGSYAQAKTPAKKSSGKSSTTASYTVRRGDTLSKIAVHHGTTVKQLCHLNGISTSTKLKTGRKIRIR